MTPASPSASAPTRPLRLLVADGDSLAVRTATLVLGLAGHDVSTAAASDAALDRLKEHGFDAALIALDLPGLGGIETAKLYRFLALGRPRMPIIALASRWTLDACARGAEAGIEIFVAKPLVPEEIEAALVAAVPAASMPEQIEDVFGVVTPLFRRAPARAPAIDVVLLGRLQEIGGRKFVQEIVDEFTVEAAAALQALRAAVRAHSLVGTRAAGERIEALAGSIGAGRLVRMGVALADITAAEFARRAEDYLSQVVAEHQAVAEALVERMAAEWIG